MGILQPDQSLREEIEEFRRMLLSYAGVHRRKDEEEFGDRRVTREGGNDDVAEEKMVCVTGGVSFLGVALVNQLLLRGYSVRVIVSSQEDVENFREIELSEEVMGAHNNVEAVMATLTEVESLTEALEGCRGVFHTATFIDPAGLSGYSKCMADVEAKASQTVMEACARTSSVRKCVLTSSLLACIWVDKSCVDLSRVIDHECWSDESICIDKKLWYALGKLRAEKAAWRVAERTQLKLVTLCPGLITGPEFYRRNPTATIAYLKGGQETYADGLLASVDVGRLAEAHVSVFEAMGTTAFGRYICFENVIGTEEEAEKLAAETGVQVRMVRANNESSNSSVRFELSNMKLSRLMSRTLRCSADCRQT